MVVQYLWISERYSFLFREVRHAAWITVAAWHLFSSQNPRHMF